MSNYDPYRGVPWDLIPTSAEVSALGSIVINVKAAIKIRHDFQTAVQIADKTTRRLPGPIPPWESDFAKSSRPDAKTLAGLAAEHRRLAADAQSYIASVRGNTKLARLLRENLRLLFPDTGFRASTGEILQRLHGTKSVLQIFNPLGVEDVANLIRLLLKHPSGNAFYW
jgi:hypothetical protein